MRAITKLDHFFERTSKLGSRRLKRELERRGTLGEPLDGASLFTERIPTKESGSDLFRSDGPDAAAALSCHVDPSCGRPIASKRLLEILNDFADWLGLRAHPSALNC
jgi:hypothetical protein